MKVLRKFIRLSLTEKLLFTEALFMLYMAKLTLLIFPFRICLKTVQSDRPGSIADNQIIRQVRDAVRRANNLACWKNVCLVQSFAGAWMLRWRKVDYELHFGVKPGENTPVTAHAWLISNGIEVVPELEGYKTVLKI